MTRQKKSRKPGLQPKSNKVSKNKSTVAEQRIPKKPKGNKPGSRQQVENKKTRSSTDKPKKDPRIGSKKPIDLAPVKVTKPQTKAKKQNLRQSIAPIHVVDNSASLMEELEAIEADTYLQELVEKQDAEQPLTDQELSYLADNLDRHNELVQELGLAEEDDVEDELLDQPQTDDDLWDKFDNTDFSDYESE